LRSDRTFLAGKELLSLQKREKKREIYAAGREHPCHFSKKKAKEEKEMTRKAKERDRFSSAGKEEGNLRSYQSKVGCKKAYHRKTGRGRLIEEGKKEKTRLGDLKLSRSDKGRDLSSDAKTESSRYVQGKKGREHSTSEGERRKEMSKSF